MYAFERFWWWVVAPPHFLYRIPLVIVGALLAWALWMWLWDVLWPWARLILKMLGKVFEKVGDALAFIPRKSKETVTYLEHIMSLCDGEYRCRYHKKEEPK